MRGLRRHLGGGGTTDGESGLESELESGLESELGSGWESGWMSGWERHLPVGTGLVEVRAHELVPRQHEGGRAARRAVEGLPGRGERRAVWRRHQLHCEAVALHGARRADVPGVVHGERPGVGCGAVQREERELV